MKFLALFAVVALASLVAAQMAEDNANLLRNRKPRDSTDVDKIFGNVRLAIKGRMGQSTDKLNTEFNGWSTNVKNDNLELMHAQLRLNQLGQDENLMSDVAGKRKPGKIIHAFSFLDKQADRFNSYFLIQNDDTDMGSCYSLTSDQLRSSPRFADWTATDAKCGDNQEGTVYTREFAIADIGLDSVVAACVTADKISLFTSEDRVQNQVATVSEAEVVNTLAKPSLNDRATLLEFAVPAVCIINPKPFDFNAILQELQGEAPNVDNVEGRRRLNRLQQ